MRRIYESDAIERDDEPFTPHRRDSSVRPEAMRSINATALSRLFAPAWLRSRAVSVDVSTPRSSYAVDEPVPFTVTMRNSMPFPITLRTRSPVLWTWSVDGHTEASHVPLRDPPEERGEFRFDRGERKRFDRHWPGSFKIDEREWEPAEPGEYTLSVGINVTQPVEKGLYSETTVTIESD